MKLDAQKTLRLAWSKKDRSWGYWYPDRPDGHLLHAFVGGFRSFPELEAELKSRGYDTTTLVMTVKRTPEAVAEVKCKEENYRQSIAEDRALAAYVIDGAG